ncbi:MAG: hypothetical protein CVT86_03095 [Alphaproteobacteria bacterium HGW-Alphaproteobacteria-8]|nr:MAG: hypothetical protein CVT86_03095 [Alphaproteobacteria bacterium HGW-Alphaproteobacteria-8]
MKPAITGAAGFAALSSAVVSGAVCGAARPGIRFIAVWRAASIGAQADSARSASGATRLARRGKRKDLRVVVIVLAPVCEGWPAAVSTRKRAAPPPIPFARRYLSRHMNG